MTAVALAEAASETPAGVIDLHVSPLNVRRFTFHRAGRMYEKNGFIVRRRLPYDTHPVLFLQLKR